MSLIENALRKLQAGRQAADADGGRAAAPIRDSGPMSQARPAIPATRRQKVTADGPKHHVAVEDLIRGGLHPTPDQAAIVADEFRRIKRPLIANAFNALPNPGGPSNVIMITSALPGAGKTFCTVNLGISMSLERDVNVLLVDADVAKPHVTREFGLTDRPGLIDLLLDERLDVTETLVRTDLNDMQVLPAGGGHAQATELLASGRMSKLVAELATRYSDRIILLDSPPLLITSEAQALASHVGQVVLIVEAGSTTQDDLSHAVDALDESKSVNIVLNKSRTWRFNRGGDYSGESYGYQSFDRPHSDRGR